MADGFGDGAAGGARSAGLISPTNRFIRSRGRPLPTKGKSPAECECRPSPLLVECPPEVLLHFQIGPNDRFSSPRVPDPAMKTRAIPHVSEPADAEHAAKELDRVRSLIKPAEVDLWASCRRSMRRQPD